MYLNTDQGKSRVLTQTLNLLLVNPQSLMPRVWVTMWHSLGRGLDILVEN